MGCIRPATPGFVVTLVATALLAVVSFCVPYFKSVFFLKANISVSGHNGSITFGTLGYCLELDNGTTCSSPSIGYQLDINSLVGNKFPVEIPQVAVKWITYALFLHVVALALAAGSAVFGLLAHVREMSMACCSTCVSGFAAAVALLAFIFDLALFFVAKARINAVGTAEMGNAIWLTLAAWILLFFSGCFYSFGRCCISNRPSRGDDWKKKNRDAESDPSNNGYAEQMRLDAVKAEADRKARQKATEGGLPAFSETQPLTARVEGDHVYIEEPYMDNNIPPTPQSHGTHLAAAGGYLQAPAGSRAVDEYYSPSQGNNATYPPQPQRQPSAHSYAPSTYAQNIPNTSSPPLPQGGYAAAAYTASPYGYNAPVTTSPPPLSHQLSPQQQYAQGYGHSSGGSSYHTAADHAQQPTNYSEYDPFNAQPQTGFNAETYNNTALLSGTGYSSPPMPPGAAQNPYLPSSTPPQQYAHDRSYTLGGDGYGSNSVPPLSPHTSNPQMFSYQGETPTAPSDAPPGYEYGSSGTAGAWGKH